MVNRSSRSSTVVLQWHSFHAFYEDEYRRLAGFGYVITGDWTAAEDLAQETMVQVHRHWGKVAGYEDPAGWARRVLINKHRSRIRRLATEAKAVLRLGGQRVDPIDVPHDVDHMFALVRRLPERQAHAVALRYWDDLSISQIASVLECGTETVKTHLSRGRASLAAMIAEELGDQRSGGLIQNRRTSGGRTGPQEPTMEVGP